MTDTQKKKGKKVDTLPKEKLSQSFWKKVYVKMEWNLFIFKNGKENGHKKVTLSKLWRIHKGKRVDTLPKEKLSQSFWKKIYVKMEWNFF